MTGLGDVLRALGSTLGYPTASRQYLMRQHDRLPLLDLDDGVLVPPAVAAVPLNRATAAPTTTEPSPPPSLAGAVWEVGDLKEIVIPAYWSDTYADQRSLFATLQESAWLTRPAAGLYRLPLVAGNSAVPRVCLRPLPMGKEDRTAVPSPPTLVFHAADLDAAAARLVADHDTDGDDGDGSAKTAVVKIGYTGQRGAASRGQLVLLDAAASAETAGVDIRLCAAPTPSSVFAEAQASLLASSLSELQSKHVLSSSHQKSTAEKNSAATRDADLNTNQMDCWVEFRASLRNPLGFLPRRRRQSASTGPKIAKAPDLPYE